VQVALGQEVKQGDVLVILEAMKMETQVVAEKDGIISFVAVQPNDEVKVGDQLVSIA
jgi:oxaloacetate decarboxylase alpha subunit